MSKNQVRADFHIHTSFSQDAAGTPMQLIERCTLHGLTSIAVTDHDTIEGALAVQRLAPFQVIIGEEISSAAGHIIGLFLKRVVRPGLSVPDTINEIKSQGGIAVAPHPFSRLARRESLHEALVEHVELFDCIEVRNSNNFLKKDCQLALDFAQQHGKAQLAGSDSHIPAGIGDAVVTMPSFSSAEDFMVSVKEATLDYRVHSPLYFTCLAALVARLNVRRGRQFSKNAVHSIRERSLRRVGRIR